jgi:hypothetical protein
MPGSMSMERAVTADLWALVATLGLAIVQITVQSV